MAKVTKRKGGRVTPKGTTPGGRRPAPAPSSSEGVRHAAEASSRYTPPVPREKKISPPWVPVLMFSLLGLGMLVILLNYVGFVPGGTSNWYLLVGLGCFLGGIITSTQYR